jgi:prophage DNA circulation protein
MISSTILAVLAMIEQILPLIGTSSATVTMIESVVTALTQLMPYIVNEISTVYTATKNIISQLQNSGAPTADQLTALTSLDAQVDAAWASVQTQIDPDNPANAGTPAGDPGATPAA